MIHSLKITGSTKEELAAALTLATAPHGMSIYRLGMHDAAEPWWKLYGEAAPLQEGRRHVLQFATIAPWRETGMISWVKMPVPLPAPILTELSWRWLHDHAQCLTPSSDYDVEQVWHLEYGENAAITLHRELIPQGR